MEVRYHWTRALGIPKQHQVGAEEKKKKKKKDLNLPKAMQLCEDWSHHGIKPDIVTCSALMSACEKGRDQPRHQA